MERHSQPAKLQRQKAISRDPITPNRDNSERARARRLSPRRLHFAAAAQEAAQPSQSGAAGTSGSMRHGGIGRKQAQRVGAASIAGGAYDSASSQREGAAGSAAVALQGSCSLTQRGAGDETSGGKENNACGVPTPGRRPEIVIAVTENMSACCEGYSGSSAARLAAGGSWRIRPRPGQAKKSRRCQSTITIEAWSLETMGENRSHAFGLKEPYYVGRKAGYLKLSSGWSGGTWHRQTRQIQRRQKALCRW